MQHPWPWEETDPEKAAEAKRVLKYTYIHGGIKYLLVSPLLTYFGAQVQKSPFITDMALEPSTGVMLTQMGIMFIVEDFMSYVIHMLFHHPLLYRFHKEHHEYKYVIPIAAWHFHYVEYFLLQIFTFQTYFAVVQLYAPLHISTLMIWFIFRFWNNNSTHCGYIFPWTPTSLIPFCLND
jgi:sterol desaturase/sphingolipid hydroxylase (fatty acid hydroxylase superfamily)